MSELLRRRHKFDEAEPLIREALEGRRETLGTRHADTLHSLVALGITLKVRRKLDEAESLLREALEVRQETKRGAGQTIPSQRSPRLVTC